MKSRILGLIAGLLAGVLIGTLSIVALTVSANAAHEIHEARR